MGPIPGIPDPPPVVVDLGDDLGTFASGDPAAGTALTRRWKKLLVESWRTISGLILPSCLLRMLRRAARDGDG